MASAVIGSLRVNLGIDSAQFQKGLKQAQTGLNTFGKSAAVGLGAVATAATAMAGAMGVAVKRTIDAADEMGKAAQKFGVGVEELSRLAHAADLSGVSLEGLGTGLRKLAQNMQETAKGAQNTASQAFDALGISVKNADGSLKSSSGIMEEVAGRFGSMEDGAQKTAIAMAIFGRSGADLIPMLNAGRDGLRSMMEEADQLGIVLSDHTAKAAEAFNDNLTRVGKAQDAIFLKISANLLPVLELLSEKLIKVANNSELIETGSNRLTDALGFVSNEVAQLAILSSRLSAEFAGISEAFGRLSSGDFSGAWAAFQEGQEKSAKMAADLKEQITEIFDGSNISQGGIARRFAGAFGDAGDSAGETFVAKFEETATKQSQNAFERLAASLTESTASMQADAGAIGMADGAAARYTATLDLLAAASEAKIPITAALTEQINMLANSWANANLQMEGARLGLELLNDPFAILQQELAKLDEMLAGGAISWEQWKDASIRAKMAVASEVLGLAGQLTGALGQMFGDSKAFAIAEAVINTAQAITKTLALYGATPWGIAAAGVAAASGAAQIATIARTNKGSKAAPSVSGGSGGASGAANQEAGSSQAMVIQLHGDVYSKQSVEALFEQINEGISDGHKLVIKTV